MLSNLSASTQARLRHMAEIFNMPDAPYEPTLSAMRILLVHPGPEPELTRTLAHQGADVLTVADDERPVPLLAVFKPDVVLVVARDCAEMCHELRRAAPEVAIVAIVASVYVEDLIAALEAGADDCLSRPFHRRELVARIRAARRRTMLTAASSPPADEHAVEGAA
jgi:DNA-binding response OmpR family regulator